MLIQTVNIDDNRVQLMCYEIWHGNSSTDKISTVVIKHKQWGLLWTP